MFSIIKLLRLNTLIGIFLLFTPILWVLITYKCTNLFIYLYFFIGCVLTRSLGCLINDYLDANIDSQVLRTSVRPQTKANNNPIGSLFIILSLLCIILSSLLPIKALIISFFCAILIIIYPLSKRVFILPQLILALAFSLPTYIVLYSQWITCVRYSPINKIFCASMLWTLVYDTIYAYQDLKFDKLININSSALWLEKKTQHDKIILIICGTCVGIILQTYIFCLVFCGLMLKNFKLIKNTKFAKDFFNTYIIWLNFLIILELLLTN